MAHAIDYDNNIKESRISTRFQSWYRNKGLTMLNDLTSHEQDYLKSGNFLDKGYDHGIMYGMFTQNKRNVSVRSVIPLITKKDDLIEYTFFPHVADKGDPMGWIFSVSSDSDIVESLNINEGYNDVTGYIKTLGYDKNRPHDSLNKKTRVAFSERRIVESFRDGYRAMNIGNQQDFETNYGEIVRIEELYGMLLTVRNRAVMRHQVGQKEITEDLSYADSTIYLSPEAAPMIYYGIQDWHAFLKTKNAIYAIDVRNAMIFKVAMQKTQAGKSAQAPALMSQQYMIEGKTKDLVESLSDSRTTPIDMNGISIGYNEDFGEVYFSFINGEQSETLVFNENLGFFTGTSDITASLYVEFGKGVLTTFNGLNAVTGTFYSNNNESGNSVFYGTEQDNILSFVVNGNSEEENTSVMTKIFESLSITSPHTILEKITYETETQKGEYAFTENSAEFWKDARWVEGSWIIPIVKENVADDDDYLQSDSVLRGRWLKVTLYFRAGKEFYINEVITKFNISYS
jgi:hypothetical protein